MSDPAAADQATPSHCPWCSAVVTHETTRCPSCGAVLREEEPADIPGVTQIDPAASVARPTPRTRSLIGWLSGQYETESTEADRGSIEPPSDAVKQEMMRLEIEAIRAELEAQAAEDASAAGTVPKPDEPATGDGAAT